MEYQIKLQQYVIEKKKRFKAKIKQKKAYQANEAKIKMISQTKLNPGKKQYMR